MKKLSSLLVILLLLIFHPAEAQKRNSHKLYPVLRVIDGDTFRVNDGSPKGMIIRLIGVDAPETRNTGHKVKSKFGSASTEYLRKLIGEKRIRIEYDIDPIDRYGRTLAYVYLEDGTFVNAELVKNGYANTMTVQPNIKYQALFLKLEERARKKGLGLWGR
jgi:micrococcal nuclease